MLRYFTVLQSVLAKPLEKDEGATAVEYGLMVLLIALFIIGSVTVVGTNLDAFFTTAGDELAP